MPANYPGLSETTYWAIGIVSAILLFISVLVHELSHSIIAKRNGLPIARITLFFFGGVSEITEEPRDPALEVWMAGAGPLTSFAIAIVLGAFWLLSRSLGAPIGVAATLRYSAYLNGVLGGFNLIPAFPLDGGRVLRGGLWKRSRNLLRATRTAVSVSETISLMFMLAGFALLIFLDFVNGLWVLFLGWFIRSGAETSLRQTQVTEALGGVQVGDLMTRDPLSVPPEMPVQQLARDYFLARPHGGYPVTSNGKLLGIVTMQSIRSIPIAHRETATVKDVMVPYERMVTVTPTASGADALRRMAQHGVGRLLVTDGESLLGIVTRGDLLKAIRTRQELVPIWTDRPKPA